MMILTIFFLIIIYQPNMFFFKSPHEYLMQAKYIFYCKYFI